LVLDEDQRKAKTEALKNLLLNPRPQRPVSSPRLRDHSIMFSSRPSTPHSTTHNILPVRHSSGPSTPVPFEEPKNLSISRSDNQNKGSTPHHYLSSACISSPNHRTPSSNLRQELSATISIPATGVSTQASHPSCNPSSQGSFPRQQRPLNNSSSPTPDWNISLVPTISPARASSTSMRTVEAKQMEDDLRRILKIDVNSGLEPNGVRSSFA
jgi:hypothetical protein